MVMANLDGLGAAFVAFALLMGLCIFAAVLLIGQVSLALRSRSAAAPSAWRRLAFGWWGVMALGLFIGALILSQVHRVEAPALLAVLAAVVFPAVMGALATWSGTSLFQPGADVEAAQRRVRRVNLLPLGLVLLFALLAGGMALVKERARLAHDRALQAESARMQAEREARWEELRQREREAEQAKQEAERREREEAEQEERACTELARALQEPAPAATEPQFKDPEARALARRLVQRALEKGDVGSAAPRFPCMRQHRALIVRAYAQGLTRRELWTLDTEPSYLAREALVTRQLEPRETGTLIVHLDGLALTAMKSKDPRAIAHAREICKLAKIMVMVSGARQPERLHSCPKLESLSK